MQETFINEGTRIISYKSQKMNKLLNYVAALLMLPVAVEAQDYSKYYQNLPVEVKQVSRPVIPANEISLKDVGGVGDGVTLNTEAFNKGISKLNKLGGGRLNIPEGVWLTGPISLKDNIEFTSRQERPYTLLFRQVAVCRSRGKGRQSCLSLHPCL